MMRNILITGGAGFISSHVVRLFVNKYPEYNIVNLDKLTYAGNLANLKDVENKPNYTFVKADIADLDKMRRIITEHKIDSIIHLAAESHVDRSIKDPFTFARTNVMGTLALLQAAKEYWESLLKNTKASSSITSLPMKSMERLSSLIQKVCPHLSQLRLQAKMTWPTALSSSSKRPNTILTRLIRLPRHRATIL